MKLYRDYLATKHHEDDFLRWLLIRKLNLKQQLFVIAVLWFLWVLAWPNLVFWVFFFKATLIYCTVTAIIGFILKRVKRTTN